MVIIEAATSENAANSRRGSFLQFDKIELKSGEESFHVEMRQVLRLGIEDLLDEEGAGNST